MTIDAKSNALIFIAVALSLIASLLVSCIGVTMAKGSLVMLNDHLLAEAEHHGNYCSSS